MMRTLSLAPSYWVQLPRQGRLTVLLVLVLLMQQPVLASALNFDTLASSTILTNQYPGASFLNTIILTSGVTLNELEFPPHSGANVASDQSGPMTVSFTSPIKSFTAYFTYSLPLTLQALDATNNPVASANTAYSSNEALSGDAGSQPSELVQIFSPSIHKIVITGGAQGSSFSVDDMTLISRCDINSDGVTNVADTQLIVDEALGLSTATATDDLSGSGAINVVDVQIVINAALGLGCAAR